MELIEIEIEEKCRVTLNLWCIDYSTDPYCALCYRSWVARVNQITIVRTTPTHDGGEAAVTHGGEQ